MFECVVNISEGRDAEVLDALAEASGASLRDRHADADHHRSVFTLIHERARLLDDVHGLIEEAFARLDLSAHAGVHPRLGVVDVVPFVALGDESPADACALRDETAHWIAASTGTPVFCYGPRADGTALSLPAIRRRAFASLAPDEGPAPDPRRGAVVVGCRPVLVAWNLWLRGITLDEGRELADLARSSAVRALAFPVSGAIQVSCNLLEPLREPPSAVYDLVAAATTGRIERAELVGLAPAALLAREDPERLAQLDLDPARTIEARCGVAAYPA
ncbi:MAG: hypothetical protein ACP5OV_03730 [Acidimicrobiales bacterium]